MPQNEKNPSPVKYRKTREHRFKFVEMMSVYRKHEGKRKKLNDITKKETENSRM